MAVAESEQVLYDECPVMFRSSPVGFIVSIVLIPALGLGLLILLGWWLQCQGTRLTITNTRITLRTGILSKNINEVWHSNVRNVQVSQSFFQRIFDVGKVGISTAGQSGIEIEVAGIPTPSRVRDLINEYRSSE